MGLTTEAKDQPLSPSMARLSLPRWARRATRITTRKMTLSKVDVAAGVPPDEALHDPEPDAGAEGDRQRLHAGHDGGGQRRQQHDDALPGRRGGPGERRLEHEGEGGEAAGQGPHDRGQAADRDAQEQGPVGVLGGGPDGDARVGPEEEPGQAER